MMQRLLLFSDPIPFEMPLASHRTPTTACPDAELDELFDFAAASSGEPLCELQDQCLTSMSPQTQTYHSMLWSSGDAGQNPLKSDDIGGSLPLYDHLAEPEDFIVPGLSSPLSSQGSPFSNSFPSSLASTPEAVFSSTTTNTLSLPEDLDYQDLMDYHLSIPYLASDDLAAYGSPDIIPSSELPTDWSEYSPLHVDALYSHPDFTGVAPLPDIVVDSPPSENLALFPDDTEIITTLDENSTRFIATNDVSLSYDPFDGTLVTTDSSITTLRRSSRTSRKIGDYREPDESDGSLSDPPATPPPSRSLKRKSDDHEYQGWNVASSSGSSPTRSRKGSRRPAQRRKILNLPCGVGSCTQTFGRENDRKRHWLSASVHKREQPMIMESLNLPFSQTQCEMCGEHLSRPDARLRHERDKSCGKRVGRKKGGAKAVLAAPE